MANGDGTATSSEPRSPAQPAGERPRLALCYGTRPQVIKASVLAEVLGRRWPLLTIDTGQHYDYELNRLLYEQLGVRRPDYFLGVGSGGHAAQTAAILTGAAEVFSSLRPWAVVVLGDTNSTLGCALAAAQLRIPVAHVEAGLRARDGMMAEEINRRTVDGLSTLLCAPSRASEEQLRREQARGAIVRTGDVARDVLTRHLARVPPVESIEAWPLAPGAPFAFATLHRAELVDSATDLAGALEGLGRIGIPVVLSLHPRTRVALERWDLLGRLPPALHVRPPLGYLEGLACIREAAVVVTDSGGVQREAYWLGTPCVTVRAETEWGETVELGANTTVVPSRAGTELPKIARPHLGSSPARGTWDRGAYGAGNAADLICEAISRVMVPAP